MKKIQVCLSFILLSTLGLVSCTKKNGENQGLSDSNKKTYDFMSTKPGSWWLYTADDGSVFYRYATGMDSMVSGLTFSYYYRIDTTSSDRDKTPEYFGKNGDKYITLIDLDGSQSQYITFVILKDSWAQGQTWTNTERKKISGWNVDMLIESEVKDVNASLSYNGITYDSVIYVYSALKAKSVVMPAYINCGKLEVWFKKGVGIIKEQGDINVIELVKKTYSDHIVDYHIEP